MSISPISSNHYQAQLLALSALQAESVAATGTTASVEQSGDMDLFLQEKLYREKAAELAKRSQASGTYERETLSDSEIKSLKAAGVPIDAFLAQHGQKLGSREYNALAELIMKTIEKQAQPTAGNVASATASAPTDVAARAFV
ncbi:hypothetical protein L602_004700000110 [Cupriavidus gilardii J11]|uniref:Uncharacterized protein n=1 Tax=Cupriavidus gilardii J11 TaxID=936133 RepID=A0A562B7M1_9BURK|nr:hypothetical protein [Cupriavidus gilardii]TWG81073.1 hypothetical protein L602_004700000110 [Cupriavidus gilardii J11]